MYDNTNLWFAIKVPANPVLHISHVLPGYLGEEK